MNTHTLLHFFQPGLLVHIPTIDWMDNQKVLVLCSVTHIVQNEPKELQMERKWWQFSTPANQPTTHFLPLPSVQHPGVCHYCNSDEFTWLGLSSGIVSALPQSFCPLFNSLY